MRGSAGTGWLVVSLGVAMVLLFLAADHASGQNGRIDVSTPESNDEFLAGETIAVSGRVVESNGAPIAGITVLGELVDAKGDTMQTSSAVSSNSGSFFFSLQIPDGLPGGTFLVRLTSSNASVEGAEVGITVRAPVTLLPVGASVSWAWLAVIIASVSGVFLVLAYLRFIAPSTPGAPRP